MSYLLSLRNDVKFIASPLVLVIQSATKRYSVTAPSPGLTAAVHALANSRLSEPELFAFVSHEPASEYDRLTDLLTRFRSQGWVCVTVPDYVTLIPQQPDYKLPAEPFDPTGRHYQLSRFAYLRREGDVFLLETPLAPVQIRLESVSALTILEKTPASGDALEALKLLYDAHMLQANVESEALASWEFHDLLFHARSRRGNHAYPMGATWRFGSENMPPVFRPEYPGPNIALAEPDWNRSPDLPFGVVMETRHSIRQHGEKPITRDQLGEFLYRVNRVRTTWQTDNITYSSRPFPSGGALYELELYPIVQHCDGVERGLYHYRPQAHSLTRVSGWSEHTQALFTLAGYAIASPESIVKLQILIVIAARFPRLARKYEGIAYALILKHVGVLYQTMYLVATAMRLAPCGTGSGNSHIFAAATGNPFEAEGSVGEFLLGSLPDS